MPSEDPPLQHTSLTDLTDLIAAINSSAVEAVPEEPDVRANLEKDSVELDQKRAELESFKQDTGERKRYAKKIFILTCTWVTGIYILMLLEGFGGFWCWAFHLSDSIMLAAIGSTTANIIGVFFIVTRYFFPKKHS
ncbi:MAG: hypothetical protein ACLPXT_05445 [Terracidiphilus sp.]